VKAETIAAGVVMEDMFSQEVVWVVQVTTLLPVMKVGSVEIANSIVANPASKPPMKLKESNNSNLFWRKALIIFFLLKIQTNCVLEYRLNLKKKAVLVVVRKSSWLLFSSQPLKIISEAGR
jgi:hypothetical protein